MKIDWKRKLTSRKWWVAVAALVSGLILAFGGGDEVAQTVSGCIMATAAVIGYTIGEGLADSANKGGDDNFSRTVIAGYYITAPEIKSRENYESYKEDGYKRLINAVEENYRPAIALLEYLSQKGRIKGMSKKKVSEFRLRNNPPMSENNWYE